jgi:hypothetical protein
MDGQLNPFRISELQAQIAIKEIKKLPIFPILKAWAFVAATNLDTATVVVDPRVPALVMQIKF